MTERWKPTPEELKRILEEHEEWVESSGEKGKRADLRRADLIEAELWGRFLAEADLSEAHLSGADLRGADLCASDLWEADLRSADLSEADLTEANVFEANLSEADLSSANLREADLRGANLSGVRFPFTNLLATDLTGAQLRRASFTETVFANTSLRQVKGLETVEFFDRCTIDLRTIELSWPLPESFLRGCGLSDTFIQQIPSLFAEPIQLYSCFISYSTKDEEFATRLHNDFQAAAVRCWKWDHDARTGRSLMGEITDAIRLHEKVVLIASESSLKSPAVNREIERACQQEDELTKKKNDGEDVDPDVLFPVRIDDYVFEHWEHERKPDVVKKVIADATDWKDPKKYAVLRDKLIADLKKARTVVGR